MQFEEAWALTNTFDDTRQRHTGVGMFHECVEDVLAQSNHPGSIWVMGNVFPRFHDLLYHSLRMLYTQEVCGEGPTECDLVTGLLFIMKR